MPITHPFGITFNSNIFFNLMFLFSYDLCMQTLLGRLTPLNQKKIYIFLIEYFLKNPIYQIYIWQKYAQKTRNNLNL